MEQIENAAFQRRGKSFSRNKKQQLRIDMTSMVDLGFLLITFFVFTTSISSPAAMTLFMPNDKSVTDSNQIQKSLALTVLLDDHDRIYYYHGKWEDARKANEVFESNFSSYSGIGKVIREKQKSIDADKKFPDGRIGLMLIIKPTTNAAYRNVIDMLDEVIINDVKKYAVVEPVSEEIIFLEKQRDIIPAKRN